MIRYTNATKPRTMCGCGAVAPGQLSRFWPRHALPWEYLEVLSRCPLGWCVWYSTETGLP